MNTSYGYSYFSGSHHIYYPLSKIDGEESRKELCMIQSHNQNNTRTTIKGGSTHAIVACVPVGAATLVMRMGSGGIGSTTSALRSLMYLFHKQEEERKNEPHRQKFEGERSKTMEWGREWAM